MKHVLCLLCFMIIVVSVSVAQEPQGYIEYKEDKTIVRVWGTHYERGYAQGYLLCDEIVDVFSNYFLAYLFGNNATLYNSTRNVFVARFEVDDTYLNEGSGVLDGIIGSGNSLYNSVLGRNLDVTDLMMCNSIVDFADDALLQRDNFMCSSLASWGTSTSALPELNGESIITRFLDWTPHQTLLDNHILLVSFPTEQDEQDWIGFTFPGLFGCLSGINRSNVGSFYNVGNNDSYDPNDTFNPIFLSVRNGIEASDYDNSGECNPMDVVKAVSDDVQRTGSIMNVISSTEKDSFSLVVECNNINGIAVRTQDDNTLITGDNLAATNHFRKLYTPVYCYRYDHIADSLLKSTEIDPTRSWRLLSGAAGISTNIQAIQYIPSTGEILWATRTGSNPAYKEIPTAFTTSELFGYVNVDDPSSAYNENIVVKEIFPQPSFQNITIKFMSKQTTSVDLSIYDIKGRLGQNETIQATHGENEVTMILDQNITSGLYFMKCDDHVSTEVRKILIVR